MSTWLVEGGLAVEDLEDSAGEVAFDASADFSVGFALGSSFGYVGLGFWVGGHFGDRDHV